MITLLIAYLFWHLNVHWVWWVLFGFVVVKKVFDEVME
jgi:hypothetical protein